MFEPDCCRPAAADPSISSASCLRSRLIRLFPTDSESPCPVKTSCIHRSQTVGKKELVGQGPRGLLSVFFWLCLTQRPTDTAITVGSRQPPRGQTVLSLFLLVFFLASNANICLGLKLFLLTRLQRLLVK